MFAGGPVHVFIHDAILSSLYIITQPYLSVSERRTGVAGFKAYFLEGGVFIQPFCTPYKIVNKKSATGF